MKYILFLLAFATISCETDKPTPTSDTSDTSINDQQAVRACYNAYKSAILNDQGQQAVQFVDQKTIQYYQDMLDQVIAADSATVSQLNVMDKILVLMLRQRLPKDTLLRFDGTRLLVHAIQEGMVGKNSVSTHSIGTVTVNQQFAKGQVLVQGNPTSTNFHFYKENDQWKLNLTAAFPLAIATFQKAIQASGQSENAYIFLLLEQLNGTKPSNTLWQPIQS